MQLHQVLLLVALCPLVGAGTELREYQTRHYALFTDLDPQQVRIVSVRMDKLADEYAGRLQDYGAVGRKKLAFYLYGDAEDYYATGAPRDSAGRFSGTALLAVAQDFGPRTWHIIQHEGFHQFAAAVFKAQLPPWVDEGLAEYFGEAIFTGDGYVTGAIPQWRLDRIRARFKSGEFRPLDEFLSLPASQWATELSLANYDQAWSLVQYFAHGEGAKHQARFGDYMRQLAAGAAPQKAWSDTLGQVPEVEADWREYWLNLPKDPTPDVYAEATVAALTSFLARGYSQGQTFVGMGEFERAGLAEQVSSHPDDWLPPAMLADALRAAMRLVDAGASIWLEIPSDQRLPTIQFKLPDGTRIVGRFTIKQGRVASVTVQRDPR